MRVYCNREWSRKYIASQFPQSFIEGQLKEHRKQVLFDKEHAKFPQTLETMSMLDNIKNEINRREKKNAYYSFIDMEMSIFKIMYDFIENHSRNIQDDKKFYDILYKKTIKNATNIDLCEEEDDTVTEIKNIVKIYVIKLSEHFNEKKYNEIYDYIMSDIHFNQTEFILSQRRKQVLNQNNIMRLEFQHDEIYDDINIGNTNANANVNTQHIKCPTQECKGFLNSDWHCILCNADACSECREIKSADTEHKCNSETVETVKLLQKDTKACPKCYTGIYKIDGCDQMWCVKCHTAFSWRTGAIETKIHNPHYYEWMRSKSANGMIPREAGDIVGANEVGANEVGANEVGANEVGANALVYDCAEELDHTIIEQMFNHVKRFYTDHLEVKEHTMLANNIDNFTGSVIRCVQHIIHMKEYVLVKYDTENDFIEEFEKRCEFLRNEINEKKYKTYLEKEAKRKNKNAEITQVVQLAIDVKTDIVRRCMNVFNGMRELPNGLPNGLPNDAHNSMHEPHISFNSIVEHIDKQITIMKEVDELEKYIVSIMSEMETTYKCKIGWLLF